MDNEKELLETELIFNDKLLNAMKMEDKYLKEFIDEELNIKTSSKPLREIYHNMNALKKIEPNNLAIVKARGKSFEDSTDLTKVFNPLLSALVAIIAIYTVLSKYVKNGDLKMLFTVLVPIILIGVVISIIFKANKQRPTAIYFNELINNICK